MAAVKKKATSSKATSRKATSRKATSRKATSEKPKAAKAAKVTKVTKGAAATRTVPQSAGTGKKPRVFTISFASVYPLYVQKAQKKGRTREEVDEIIRWLTGYGAKQLQRIIDAKVDLETFFGGAQMNPKVGLIQGVVCGVRVEDVADPLMRKIRYLDKMIDELARGKPLASILRQ